KLSKSPFDGRSQPKSEFVEGIGLREDTPHCALSNVEVEPHAGIVVTSSDLDIQYHDGRPDLYMWCERVYRQVGNGWQACSQPVAGLRAVGASARPGRSAGLGFGPPLNPVQ